MALLLIFVVGAYFRFVGLNWDDFTHLHPDERFLTQVSVAIGGPLSFGPGSVDAGAQARWAVCAERYPDTNGRGGYFDAICSPLNPNNVGYGLYVYGTLPLFTAKLGADLWADAVARIQGLATSQNWTLPPVLAQNANIWRGYDGIHLVWRFINAACDLLAIGVVYLLGRQMHGRWTGVAAAALYMAAPLAIQKAHFATANTMAALFTVVAILYALRVQDRGTLWDYVGFGAAFAAALASRINLLPLVGLVIVATGMRMLPMFALVLPAGERERMVLRNMAGLALAGLTTLLLFRVLQPYAFSGPGFFGIAPNPDWLANIATSQRLVSGHAESPPNWQWVNRTSYVFPFTNMVLWGMGMAFGLAAWGAFLVAGWRIVRGRPAAFRNLLVWGWVLVYFAYMGRLWVMSMRYYLPMYPALAALAGWGVVALWAWAGERPGVVRALARGLAVGVVAFTVLWCTMFTNIYRNQLTRVQASHWFYQNVPADFAMMIDTGTGPENGVLVNAPMINRLGDANRLETQTSYLEGSFPYTLTFTPPVSGAIHSVLIPHAGDPTNNAGDEVLSVALSRAVGGGSVSVGLLRANLTRDEHPIGNSYDIPLDAPFQVDAGRSYQLTVQVLSNGPIIVSGAIVAHESSWDNEIPTKVCTLPGDMLWVPGLPSGLNTASNCNGRYGWLDQINGYNLYLDYEDVPLKRDILMEALDYSDYITISSNRFYDSLARIPYRWPMTLRYYEALFSGELGFELVVTFEETFELGPFRVSDQVLPTHNLPWWLNEFEAEEAFHVYDHPTVFIFRKTDAYDAANTARILNSVELNRVSAANPLVYYSPDAPDATLVNITPAYSLEADQTPTQLMLRPDDLAVQRAGGTWAERFDSDGPLSRQPGLMVAAWWGAVTLFGLAAWPLLASIFPLLADRGYGLAKTAGLLLVSYTAWLLGSVRVPAWNQTGVALCLAGLAVLSGVFAWRNRADFLNYLRAHWGRLAGMELMWTVAFLAFVGVRLLNPDLWHPFFGGEKPMDFAYFNAVLRSTIFPPQDPWFAGGYINYYYFGFVMVGAPVLLLKVVPSVAYNLAVPTVYACVALGAFSVAYNLVAWRGGVQGRGTLARPGNPWVAGMAALLLCAVLGNLGTPGVFVDGLMRLGGSSAPATIEAFYVREHTAQVGTPPAGEAALALAVRALDPPLADQLRYRTTVAAETLQGLGRGLGRLLGGNPLQVSSHRWYWGPTRVLGEPPVSSGNAIAEMPFFTFLYGDLHAHMLSMPLQLLILGVLLHELLATPRDPRRFVEGALAIGLAALAVGMIRATNTWEWPTYTGLGVLGLGYAWWLRWKHLGRRPVWDMLVRVGGFLAFSAWLSLPYTRQYAAIYDRVLPWTGVKAPIWAYLVVHGLFIFLLVSLLWWETSRWLGRVRVRDLRGRLGGLRTGAALLVLVVLLAVGLAVWEWRVSLLVVPLLVWVVVLFFRPGQSAPMQFVLVLAGLALALTLGVEFVVLQGDIGRQNTVFKFYLQAWLLFSVALGAGVAWLLPATGQWRDGVRGPWLATLSTLVFVAALYPVLGTSARALDRMAPQTPLTLDGMTYMRDAERLEIVNTAAAVYKLFPLVDDYNVIRFLQENVQGTPVIMEAQSEAEYRWGSRISVYTGLPSVVGWNWHQRQQRTFDPMPTMVMQRRANVNAFYTTTDVLTAARLLQFYDVGYVINSGLEQARYPEAGLAKLDRMVAQGLMRVVYTEGAAIVYEVDGAALADFIAADPPQIVAQQ